MATLSSHQSTPTHTHTETITGYVSTLNEEYSKAKRGIRQAHGQTTREVDRQRDGEEGIVSVNECVLESNNTEELV